jgi:hypothetical protein
MVGTSSTSGVVLILGRVGLLLSGFTPKSRRSFCLTVGATLGRAGTGCLTSLSPKRVLGRGMVGEDAIFGSNLPCRSI